MTLDIAFLLLPRPAFSDALASLGADTVEDGFEKFGAASFDLRNPRRGFIP
jgi:hypothetical protein